MGANPSVGPWPDDGPLAPDPAFWRGRRVLLTGHTGFKGAWLALWLHRLGAQVVGLALPPATDPNLFDLAGVRHTLDHCVCDVRDPTVVRAQVERAQPEVVLHLAAQALVRASYADPLQTWSTNVMGTANLLEALRLVRSVRVAVVVTTDKVYRNLERVQPYRESDILGGHDPYSASKAAAELVVSSYRDAFLSGQGLALASARAGNVIGGGDWAAERLLPDAARAWQRGAVLELRRPEAVRPWQHVLEPLAGYLRLVEALWQQPELAAAYNFGPDLDGALRVGQLVELARQSYGSGSVRCAVEAVGPHETGLLTLDNSLAQASLGVRPRWAVVQAVARTMDWYRRQAEGEDARSLCEADLDAFEAIDATAELV